MWGNCNAPRAITLSALIYCLRCIVGRDVPLNQVTIIFFIIRRMQSTTISLLTHERLNFSGLSEACKGNNSKGIASGSLGGGSGGRWQRSHVATRGRRDSTSFRCLRSVTRVHEQRDARHRRVGLLRNCRRGQWSRKRFNLCVSSNSDIFIL